MKNILAIDVLSWKVKEMLFSKRLAGDLRIKHVFLPKSEMASAVLYVDFFSEEEAAEIVKSNAKNLQTIRGYRPKLIPYIPLSLFPG